MTHYKVRLYPTEDQEQPCEELTGESIGIDVGIKNLAICSNGMTFRNINKTRVIKQLENDFWGKCYIWE